jgi:3-keto-5-aminohexanoate cleavage enzyme
MSLDERIAGLEAQPDVASLETGSINFGDGLFATLPSETRHIAERIKEARAVPEIEAFEIGHIDAARRLKREEALTDPLRINTVLGVRGSMAATPDNLLAMRNAVPGDAVWGVTAIGRGQWRILALAVLFGADCVRVGLEDNVLLEEGVLAPSNAALVEKLRSIAETNGRRIATPEEARGVLGLER